MRKAYPVEYHDWDPENHLHKTRSGIYMTMFFHFDGTAVFIMSDTFKNLFPYDDFDYTENLCYEQHTVEDLFCAKK